MTDRYLFVFLASFLILFAGCATYRGSKGLKGENIRTISAQLEIDKTSKEEVREKFGEPGITSSNSWTYSLEVSPDPKNSYLPLSSYFAPRPGRKRLYIRFQNGVVSNYEYNRQGR